MMAEALAAGVARLDPRKFQDPFVTASGDRRAQVALRRLDTLWFNTGTLCNLTCHNCYIESSPKNDRLVYLSVHEVCTYLAEIEALGLGTKLIGFTGGEPFMNPEFPAMLDLALARGFAVLVLTNAMKPMHKRKPALLALRERHGERLTIRLSIDHYGPAVHEAERGRRSWQPTIDGLKWLAAHGFSIAVASRRLSGESEEEIRRGFARLFTELGISLDAEDPVALTVFPEMDAEADVPEITDACWGILGKSPETVMCASSRMVVKFKGAARPSVIACTLLPYDPRFDLGPTLAGALGAVALNHPHCAKFCVLGGGACSRG
jgi:pyruvate-formate lyase-activating enzyme